MAGPGVEVEAMPAVLMEGVGGVVLVVGKMVARVERVEEVC